MIDKLEETFGPILREVREQKGYSQDKLAMLCKLNRTYISLLERGLRQPTLRTIFSLSKALEISPMLLVEKVYTQMNTAESN